MEDNLPGIIREARLREGLSQEAFGARYGVSGPAIYKFEQGHTGPSLKLWLKIGSDLSIPERQAVLLWARSRLPEEFWSYIDLPDSTIQENGARPRKAAKGGPLDYSRFQTREEMRSAASQDKGLPPALRQFLDDDDLWTLFKPTGHEINMLRDSFGPLGKGSPELFREALRLIREFSHSF